MTNTSTSEQSSLFNEEEVEHLQSLKFINVVDEHLKVISGVDVMQNPSLDSQRVILKLDIFYDNHAITPITFDLHHYSYDEIVDIARNIRDNEFILTEIDMALASWGE